mgnify:CR=1 FL=1
MAEGRVTHKGWKGSLNGKPKKNNLNKISTQGRKNVTQLGTYCVHMKENVFFFGFKNSELRTCCARMKENILDGSEHVAHA